MKCTYGGNRVSDSWLVSAGLQDHAFPERRVKVAGELWSAVMEKELERVFFPVVSARRRGGRVSWGIEHLETG